jgi:hypothetical protein
MARMRANRIIAAWSCALLALGLANRSIAQETADSAAAPVADTTAAAPTTDTTGVSRVAPGYELKSTGADGWSATTELTAEGYSWSLRRDAVAIGMRFAVPEGRLPLRTAAPWNRSAFLELPALSLGFHWLSPSLAPVPSSALDRALQAREPSSASRGKVALEWKPAESQVNFLREGLGFRLDGNDRMTVRLRKGVLGIYLQRKF